MCQVPKSIMKSLPSQPFYFGAYLHQMHPILSSNPSPIFHQQSIPFGEKIGGENLEEILLHQKYYLTIFSPHETTQSLKRRNQNHEMMNFENSGSEEDQGCKKRSKKVAKLEQKEQMQLKKLEKLKKDYFSKYRALVLLMKFLSEVKQQVASYRVDYYSTKTFNALMNSTEEQLLKITSILKRIYNNIREVCSNKIETQQSSTKSKYDKRTVQFLIIPRFLISRQKLIRMAEDDELQANFQFLIIHESLGHYNNQANKKMPEPIQMSYIRQLMKKNYGYQKFKRICSINHGNQFLRKDKTLYFQLYGKSLPFLRYLDSELKKKRKYEDIKEQLLKFGSENEYSLSDLPQDSSQQSSSSSGVLSFGSMADALNEIQNPEKKKKKVGFVLVSPMKKKTLKLISLPLKCQEKIESSSLKGFKLKKSNTGEPISQLNQSLYQNYAE